MQVKNITVYELLSRLRQYFQDNTPKRKDQEELPLRAELYNGDQLAAHGRVLAKAHRSSMQKEPDRLLKRLADNERVLHRVHNLLNDTSKENHLITPAEEWILDNFYLIEENIRTGKRHLPKRYSQALPQLQNGPSAGLPRVYDIALEIISHSDGRIDLHSLTGFIKAYQEVTTLKIGELWAIPIMLRLALIENLRRVANGIALDRVNQNLADYWAGLMVKTAEEDPKSLILVIADMARSGPPLESSFVAELTRQLLWKGPALALPLNWIEQRLFERGLTSTDLVNVENQRQAADQVSISNSIGSLRFLNSIEWREFVEDQSIVEKTLRNDPSGAYAKMDFPTRDDYRHVVEKIAKYSELSENEIAILAIKLAADNTEKNGIAERQSHVGYYLVDKGVAQTERNAAVKWPANERVQKTVKKYPLLYYVSVVLLISIAAAVVPIIAGIAENVSGWLIVIVGILALVSASHLAIALVNWIANLLVQPVALARMDFKNGIPEEASTLVTVPTMLTSLNEIERLVEQLEVRFLANKGEHLYFSLLTDLTDAPHEVMEDDEMLVAYAKNKIEQLNKKYSTGRDIFFLLHRPRVWNGGEDAWMGYERKRGKLTALNQLLTDGKTESFSEIVGDLTMLKNVKLVITLDSDTQLPRDAAWKMAATMWHPLNRPVYNPQKQIITDGYGILQPRAAITLPETDSSLYKKMNNSEPGIDPYTRLSSDLYQDLFKEGSFIGKGIYDVVAFEKTLDGKFPENRILSHDLLEGCYTRSGLLSDVQLYEDYPSRYSSDVNRRHRWIRGDWQIAWWFLPRVPDAQRRFHKNPLSLLSRWKIFDNLRRSLVPLALMLLLLLGWTVLGAPMIWTLVVVLTIALPSIIISLWNILRKPVEIPWFDHIKDSIESIIAALLQTAFTLITLPYEAYYNTDAIVRTTWRMLVSHKKLLEWKASGGLEQTSEKSLRAAYVSMWVSPAVGVLGIVYLSVYYPISLVGIWPVLCSWVAAPFIVWFISKPRPKITADLSGEQKKYLRTIARKTWAFFETFVCEAENWLPPDNYQEKPSDVVAHRTSPTNIGLSLLANLTAYDYGYISMGRLIKRTRNTMDTMARMEHFNGHLYNWYDTQTLAPLHPRYISTVDSGNMAGHLLILRQALLEAVTTATFDVVRILQGMRDTANVLVKHNDSTNLSALIKQELTAAKEAEHLTPADAKKIFDKITAAVYELKNNIKADENAETNYWINALCGQCDDVQEELAFYAPWVTIDESHATIDGLNRFHSLKELVSIHNIIQLGKCPQAVSDTIKKAVENAEGRTAELEQLIVACNKESDLDYEFLYDKNRHLFTIGYNVEEHRKDAGYYDLLASEARLGIFVAIAQGKVPQESWFALGRLLTVEDRSPILLSWSGSMFEYLMPQLVMPAFENTLLYQSNKAAVKRQIDFGRQRGELWGISESGYNMVDANLNYQYRAFGVPGLGLKRGLADDFVIAPYASVMALIVAPEEACSNMEQLSREGFEGRYGFYEAIDFTQSRLPRGQTSALIQSFMVHHQGMSLLALSQLLLDEPMQKRFLADPQFQSTVLLLQERIPKTTAFYSYTTDVAEFVSTSVAPEIRTITTPHTPIPEIQLLSNGKYQVMVSNAGGGYSKWKDIAVTRWREDTTRDNWGTFCYVRDLEDENYWSSGYQPTLAEPDSYEATFTQGRAEFRRTDNNIETHTEVVVSPEDDIEMRRVKITNRSRKKRTLDITSYAEVALAPPAADAIHPAFNKLFIQTEIVSMRNAIVCTRRPRSEWEQQLHMFHLVTINGAKAEEVSYETDRAQFIGRGNTAANPAVMSETGKLSGTEGPVLDPIVSMRYKVTLNPEESVTVDIITGISETRDTCNALIEKYQDKSHKDRVFELAWTHSQVVLRQINASETDAQLYGSMASSVIYANPALRTDAAVVIKNRRGQSGLWGYSISGDLPIVLLQIEDQANLELVKQLVQAHAYWRQKGLAVDLVIWNEDHGGYRQDLQNEITGLVAAGIGSELTDRPGGIFMRQGDQISLEDRVLFQTVARIHISDANGTLEEQLSRKVIGKQMPAFIPAISHTRMATAVVAPANLVYFNGTGGFSADGKEYVTITTDKQKTPMPWCNVLANKNFGTVISESGQSYTWMENAHEYRLTPWNNDPVSDAGGECFYLRDEESGYVWSPMPAGGKNNTVYVTRHGFGYSVFAHSDDGIDSEVTVFTDIADNIKFYLLKLRNRSHRPRKISVTAYAEWVLGDLRQKYAMHVVTEVDENNTLFARNAYNTEFSDYVAFFDTDDANRTVTGDRTEFIGRNGNLKNPEAMRRQKLSGKTGASFDPCGAMQSVYNLAEGHEQEIVFRLGAGKNKEEAYQTAIKFRGVAAAKQALQNVKDYWQKTLSTITVETPDKSLNIIANGWLAYQTIACRLWARSGYYQSGGAFGFRDQLQDVLSVMHTAPELAREQILLCTTRQFKEGDVQHWWHPPQGRGVRTRCSDDMLWLPYVTSRYVTMIKDTALLHEETNFLEGRLLNNGEESYYDLPGVAVERATVYEHCVRAIKQGMKFGPHNLPLIGSGDWNDGMDMVGKEGIGESIWLAFFLYDVLKKFIAVAEMMGDVAFAEYCKVEAETLRVNIEESGWDGGWYRRAYFDDGTPLGSKDNEECSIDSISQSWSVLSGAGGKERSRMGLEAADKRLVRKEHGLIQLLDPPFDKAHPNPGYIKGYVPGVRENGGQYTHAAIWLIMAHAAAGNAERAWELMDLVNPVNHGIDSTQVATYKVEPYVAVADIYESPLHRGRGGWTWYTGSAGWMYQLITEWLLGIKKVGDKLYFTPCVPEKWSGFKMNYRFGDTDYHIELMRGEKQEVAIDGEKKMDGMIQLADDRKAHNVKVTYIAAAVISNDTKEELI